MKNIITLFFLFTVLFISAQKTNWVVKNYTVEFKIKNAKLNVNGNFGGLKAAIKFDAANPASGSFEGNIDVNTLKTGIEMRDKHLKKAEYFNAEKFPEIILKTISLTKVKDNEFNAKCSLTLKGKTKEVTMPIKIVTTGKNAELKGTLSLNRLDYGVGSPSIIMSNNVEINISATLSQQ